MSKFAKDIKVNDILWAIRAGEKPQLFPLIIIDINIKKTIWITYYNLTIKMPDGLNMYLSLTDVGKNQDYDIPFMKDLWYSLNNHDSQQNRITIMGCFNKDKLWKHYIDGLENSMKSIKEVIEKGEQNLKELNNKLEYIKKQYDSIQEG